MTPDEKYMQLALSLAGKGIGAVEPNPAVGAVIVRDGKIIGKGYHRKFGGPHAEIDALEDCRKKGNDPAGATIYVTLEPCCHYGKTGPCTKALIEARIAKVVAAVHDPAPYCSGKGFDELKKTGIAVETGLLENEAKKLNAPFFKFAATGKAWIICKWAQSLDGFCAWKDVDPDHRWISNETSRQDAHALRRRVQAIIVGINTVFADDPLLTPRPDKDRRPLRIVLDSQLRLPLSSRLVATIALAPILVFTCPDALEHNRQAAEVLTARGVEILPISQTNGHCDLNAVATALAKRNIQQVLVEGGPCVLRAFLAAQLCDELRIYIAPLLLGKQGTAPIDITNRITVRDQCLTDLDGDIRVSGRPA